MRKFLFFTATLSLFLGFACTSGRQSGEETSSSPFGPGKTTVSVDLSSVPDSLLTDASVILMLPSIFDERFEPEMIDLKPEGKVYSATVLVERDLTTSGLIIDTGAGRLATALISLRRDSTLTVTSLPADPDGNYAVQFSDTTGFNSYPVTFCPENPVMGAQTAMEMACMKLTESDPWFAPADLADPALLSSKMDTLYARHLSRAAEESNVDINRFPWLENYLHSVFVARWVLHFDLMAQQYFGFEVDTIPAAVLSKIGSFDFESALANADPQVGIRQLLESINRAVPGIEPIGETPVKEWIASAGAALSPYVPEPSPLLLPLLATMSYYDQISANKPLTDNQIAEIKANFPDSGLAQLLLMKNEQRVKALTVPSVQDELSDADFTLQSYIDAQFPGKPVVVDLWNTWCGPCRQAQKITDPVIKDPAYSGVVFMTVCDPSSPKDEWLRMTPSLPGHHVRISEASAERLAKTYGVEGFPTFLFFDRDHKLVTQHLGFESLDSYINNLNSINN
ncbi:MAG: TlpA family protein disulfide reductase [Muribaculaceae bacterium]|nr:TlpA family protein disulfide reductase [Muribaculaceae bacterium]